MLKKLKSPKKRPIKYWKKKADVLFSKLVRARGKCERCSKTINLQCAHILSRRYKNVRHDFLNALCLCGGCHLWWHHEPLAATKWFREKYPDREEYLNNKRNMVEKVDYQEVIKRLEKMEEGEN